MEVKALATMKEENDPPKHFLIDEEANEFRPVGRSSYPKKMWGLLSCVFHKYPQTSIKSLISPFILICVFLLLSILILWKVIGSGPFGNNVTAIVAPIKGEAVPKYLTLTVLLEAQKSEPFSEAVKNCFDTAIKEFHLEPPIVKENAKMVLECDGTRKEFVSGKGENSIEVFWVDGQAHYTVKAANSQAYVARLSRQHLPLNLGGLLNVYQQLASLEGSEELRDCLNKTIEEFPKEPQVVQDNAVLEVSCGGSNVTFRSEEGKNEINVYKDMQGAIVFRVKGRGWAWWARLFVKH